MSRYLASRAVQTVVTLVLMSFVVYLLIGLMPGDPIDLMIAGDPKMTSADAARLRAVYGIDKPLIERYLAWAGQALQGNFGYSRSFNQPVLAVLWPRLLNTLVLGRHRLRAGHRHRPAARHLGRRPAAQPRRLSDQPAVLRRHLRPALLARAAADHPVCGDPGLAAGRRHGRHPAGHAVARARSVERLRFLALPVVTLTVVQLGGYTRFMRGAMIEALRQDYVRTARAKGAPERRVLWGHAFANALAPVLTILALSFGGLFSGALITETMFAWPGMGKAIYQAILDNDYNLALVGLLIATLATIVGNLLADLAYVWVDPRVSLAGSA